MEWIVIALVPAVSWAFANICDKVLVSRFVRDGVSAGILTNVFSALLVVMLLPFAPLHPLPLGALVLIFLSGAIWGWNRLAYMQGISQEEATRVVAMMQLSPVLILLGSAFFFGEVLKPADFFAFVLILAGIVWISLKKMNKAFHFSPAMLWMALSTVLFAAATLLLKKTEVGDWWSALFWINLGFAAGSVPFLAFPPYYSSVRKAFSRRAARLTAILLLIGIFTLIGRAAYFVSLQLAPAAIVSVLASLQTVFVFILALLFTRYAPSIIKEDYRSIALLNKFGAIMLLLAGIALLYWG